MRPRKSIQLCDCMVEKISLRVDKMTGPATRDALYEQMERVRDIEQQNDLYVAVHQFAAEQIAAAFKLGLQAATNPAPWIFEHEGH